MLSDESNNGDERPMYTPLSNEGQLISWTIGKTAEL